MSTTTTERHYQLWNATGLKNIKPLSLRYGEYPEGWDVLNEMRRLITPFITHRILEIGCGYGRICRAFPSQQYIGVDINTQAIEKAKILFPNYTFQHTNYTACYPQADVVLAYTVFLHVPEESIHEILRGLCKTVEHIIICEIMEDKKWDTNTNKNYDDPDRFHAVYQRAPQEYENIFALHDFYLYEETIKPYYYYRGAKIHFLHFRKKPLAPAFLQLPEDLNNPHLEMENIYDDGWVAPQFSVTLYNPKENASFFMEGLYPQVQETQPPITLAIHHQTELLAQGELNPGEFKLNSIKPLSEGKYRLKIITNSAIHLPHPDNRPIGFLLKKMGFEKMKVMPSYKKTVSLL